MWGLRDKLWGLHHEKECVALVQDILNLKSNQNPIIGSKVTAIFQLSVESIGTGQQTAELPHLEICPILVIVRLSE